jgi:hypothetical protein
MQDVSLSLEDLHIFFFRVWLLFWVILDLCTCKIRAQGSLDHNVCLMRAESWGKGVEESYLDFNLAVLSCVIFLNHTFIMHRTTVSYKHYMIRMLDS